jgi:hypothetical protein
MGWEVGVTSPKRIFEDMAWISSYSILKRIQARGAVVHGCGSCRGRRNDRVSDVAKWGGARERKSFVYRFMHPDAMSIAQQNIDSSVLKWERNDPITAVSEQDIGDVMEMEKIKILCFNSCIDVFIKFFWDLFVGNLC